MLPILTVEVTVELNLTILCPLRPESASFRMTFLVADYIPSFHVPVDFPHKTQIVQPFQG